MRSGFVVDTGWVGSKYATSPLLGLALVANYVVTGYLVPADDVIYGFNAHFYDLWASSCYAIFIVLMGQLRQFSKLRAAQRSVIAWVSGSVVGAAVQWLIIYLASGDLYFTAWMNVLPATLLSLVASCYLYALVIAAFVEGSGRTRKLRSTLRELLAVRGRLGEQLDDVAASIREPIQSRLEAFAKEIMTTLVTGGSPAAASKLLFDFISAELRPGVHTLGAKAQPRVLSRSYRSGVRLSASVRQVSLREAFQPSGAALVVTSYFAPSFLFLFDLSSAIAEILVLGLGVACWLGVVKLYGERTASWWIWALLSGTWFGAITFLAFPMARALGGTLDFELVVPTAILSALLAMCFSAMESLIVRRGKLQLELQQLNHELQNALSSLENRLALITKNVAVDLHNTVQAKLVAIALRLQNLSELSSAAIERVNEELRDALSSSRQGWPKRDVFGKRLQELDEFWSGAIEIAWDVLPTAQKMLEANFELAERVIVVLREGLTNAAKYSSDGSVSVKIEVFDLELVMTIVNSTSQSFGASNSTGMGTDAIQQAATTVDWALKDGVFSLQASFK